MGRQADGGSNQWTGRWTAGSMAQRARPGPAPATTAKWMSAGLCSIPETVSTGAPPAAPATPAKIATPETPENSDDRMGDWQQFSPRKQLSSWQHPSVSRDGNDSSSHSSRPQSPVNSSSDGDPLLLDVADKLLKASPAHGVDPARDAAAQPVQWDVPSSTWFDACAGETGAETCRGDGDLTPN